jgi:hypothetical protein
VIHANKTASRQFLRKKFQDTATNYKVSYNGSTGKELGDKQRNQINS